jgi:predicted dehydrogenase
MIADEFVGCVKRITNGSPVRFTHPTDLHSRRRKPLVGGNDAIRALEVAEAIHESANTGKLVELKE